MLRRSARIGTSGVVVLVIAILSAWLCTSAFAGGAGVKDRVLTDQEKVFTPAFPGDDAVVFARAYGDRNTHAHGTFGRFPAEFETPPHIHSHGYRAVVISGEMTNPFPGEKSPPVMRAGSFWSVSANSPHTTACVSKTPCEFFMFSENAFDFKPSE